MRKSLGRLVVAALTLGLASTAFAGELTVKMADGRVTVIAQEVPLRQILAEWARVGQTRMVGAEKIVGGPVTIQLVDVPEKEALDILLRSAAGYMTAPRLAATPGASLYDRVIILATSRAPVNTVTSPQPFNTNRPAIPQPLPPQPPPDDDDGDPSDQGPNVPPGAGLPGPPGAQGPGMPFPGPNMGAPPGTATPNQAPVTAPRPGLLPQPQPQNNPYAPLGPNGRPIPGPSGRGGGPGPPGIDDRN
jgi:hypothetical protein